MSNNLNLFTTAFNRVKEWTNGNPDYLPWLAENKSEIRTFAYWAGRLANEIRHEMAANAERHMVVPPGFQKAWTDFESDYRPQIDAVVDSHNESVVQAFYDAMRAKADATGVDEESLLQEFWKEVESNREQGDSFDPVHDDPAGLISGILDVFCAYADSDPCDENDKAVGAWRFFEETLGINHARIHERWKRIPHLLIPSHASRRDTRPIVELYNEAARCYMFGNNCAAMVLCRALLEHLFKVHFQVKGEDLSNIIALAEQLYENFNFRKLELQRFRRNANELLHRYEANGAPDDKAVEEFLATIKHLVSHIPKQPR